MTFRIKRADKIHPASKPVLQVAASAVLDLHHSEPFGVREQALYCGRSDEGDFSVRKRLQETLNDHARHGDIGAQSHPRYDESPPNLFPALRGRASRRRDPSLSCHEVAFILY